MIFSFNIYSGLKKMRLSNLLLLLAFLLSIGSISAQNLTGTWVNPNVTKDYARYCCVPSSIQIDSAGDDRYTATYKAPPGSKIDKLDKDDDVRCFNFFKISGNGRLNLTSSGILVNTYFSDTKSIDDSMWFYYKVENSSKGPILEIWTGYSSYIEQCEFTMELKSKGFVDSLI